MNTPYISTILRRRAERMGFSVEVRTHTTARPKGWPQRSSRPVHLMRDGKHVASFADGIAANTYLAKLES
jgi:hypothetical protein